VYMVGMEEGILPHHRSIADAGAAVDEERRLCYVGVTRAQRRLTLTLALSRQKWGKARPTIPSRFLYELTGQADNPNYLAAKRGRHAAGHGGVPHRKPPGGAKPATPVKPRKSATPRPPGQRPGTAKKRPYGPP
jgi:DNA helicase II / ATP-dependent DNA helicase PcrA